MAEDGSLNNDWQVSMLPVMQRMIIGLTLFFFLTSFAQLYYLHQSIGRAPQVNFEPVLSSASDQGNPPLDRQEVALLLLEANALERRHHQANVLLMSRVWVRYLGFVTGMILSLVGAIFILGKLREPQSEIFGDGKLASISIRSASPGVLLAAMGVVLMLATILTHNEIQVRDAPVFVGGQSGASASTAESSKPVLDS